VAKPLACQELVELVTDYLEGRLARRDRRRFEAHIGECEGCTAYLAQMRETIRLTGRLTEEQIPEAAKAKLLEIFREWRTA
jgi:anti-sigma factor RsiW